MENKRILITGASGYVGSKIYNDLKESGFDVKGTYYKTQLYDELIQVDLTNREQISKILKEISPDIIIHTAADAHTKTCENSPKYARKINVESTRFLTEYAKKHDTRFIHISTFACYNPSNVYGKTKYEAEQLVSALNNYVILRPSLIIGSSPNVTNSNFFNNLIIDLQKDTEIEADISWEFEMTSLSHLSELVKHLIEKLDILKIMIPVIEHGITSRYIIASELSSIYDGKVVKIDQNRAMLLPEIEDGLMKELGLPDYSYKESIETIKEELQNK